MRAHDTKAEKGPWGAETSRSRWQWAHGRVSKRNAYENPVANPFHCVPALKTGG